MAYGDYMGYRIVSHNPRHMGSYKREVHIFKGKKWVGTAKSISHAKEIIRGWKG